MFREDLENEKIYSIMEMNLKTSQIASPVGSAISFPARKEALSDLWVGKSPRQRCVLVVIPLSWFTVDILSYGMSFSINDMDIDLYNAGYIIGGVSVLVALTGTLVANNLGRKGGFFLAWGFAACGMLVYQFASSVPGFSYILLCISRYGASAAFGFCFLITSEYFPTVFRGVMFGICNACARLGGIIAPEFSTVFFVGYFMLAFGFMALLMFLLNCFIYETKDKPMADNVSDPNLTPKPIR